MINVNNFLSRVVPRNLRTNTQRVLRRLLTANGGWVSGRELRREVRSEACHLNEATTARVRDLRKPQYGSFDVECRSARELHRAGGLRAFFYRINPRSVTVRQVATVLNVGR